MLGVLTHRPAPSRGPYPRVSCVGKILAIQQFGEYLHSIGEREHYVLPRGIGPKTPRYVPYLFTEDELRRLFSDEVMGTLKPYSLAKSRHYVLPQLFSTIHCCGLRPSEATGLLAKDVNLAEGWLDIRGTKTYRDRRLPIGESLLAELRAYDELMQQRLPGRTYFFPKTKDERYKGAYPSTAFKTLLRKHGIAQPSTGPDGRLYDLRHHFVFRNINRWIDEGKDVDALLPYLRLYLGHSSIKETEYYLHWVPEYFPVFERLYGGLAANLPEVSDGQD
jgi:integrase/recombinase XerD